MLRRDVKGRLELWTSVAQKGSYWGQLWGTQFFFYMAFCPGVIWRGDSLIEGVPETLDFLRSLVRPLRNNESNTHQIVTQPSYNLDQCQTYTHFLSNWVPWEEELSDIIRVWIYTCWRHSSTLLVEGIRHIETLAISLILYVSQLLMAPSWPEWQSMQSDRQTCCSGQKIGVCHQ